MGTTPAHCRPREISLKQYTECLSTSKLCHLGDGNFEEIPASSVRVSVGKVDRGGVGIVWFQDLQASSLYQVLDALV